MRDSHRHSIEGKRRKMAGRDEKEKEREREEDGKLPR